MSFDNGAYRYDDFRTARLLKNHELGIKRQYSVKRLFLFGVCATQDDACSADGEERAVADDTTFTLFNLLVVDKCARIAVVVAERIAQPPMLVAADVDGAMVQVHAGVDRLERCVDGIALLVAPNDVVAHLQRQHLLVVENVLNDNDGTEGLIGRLAAIVGVQRGILLLQGALQLRYTQTDTKRLAAVRTLENELLAVAVPLLIKGDVLLAFGTTYSFHGVLILRFIDPGFAEVGADGA